MFTADLNFCFGGMMHYFSQHMNNAKLSYNAVKAKQLTKKINFHQDW